MIVKIIERQGTFNLQPRVVRVVRVYDFKVPAGITTSSFTQKGSLLVGTGNGTYVEFPPGANGNVLTFDNTQPAGVTTQVLQSQFPPAHINGLMLSNNVTDPINDIDVSMGSARDDSDTVNMRLTSAMTKRLDAAWVAGNGNGGLDTGSKANNTTYHKFIIAKGDGTTDLLFSKSYASPTMPTGYLYKRRIGAVSVDGSGVIRPFIQNGDRFYYKTPVLDVNDTNLGTTRVDYILSSVPSGAALEALVNVMAQHSSGYVRVYLSNPSLDNLAPSVTGAPLFTLSSIPSGIPNGNKISLLTNASGQISAISDSAFTTIRIATLGWIDPRRLT